MSTIGHNSSKRLIEVDEEILDFIITNCESNMEYTLHILQSQANKTLNLSKDTLSKLVNQSEKFKKLRLAALKAKE